MILEQRSLEEIFTALCRQAGDRSTSRQVVFFVPDGPRWNLASAGDLTRQAEAALAAIDPERLSNLLFTRSSLDGDQSGYPFEYGWARHLVSGMGELLGLFISLADGPIVPFGTHAARIQSVCRLATLAIEHKNQLRELAFNAHHDTLTGLFNRSYFERILAWTLAQRSQTGGSAALLCVNLDRFRLVNDVLGHSIGDELLANVARRLESCVQAPDVLARAGGDDFTILLPQVSDPAEAAIAADRLLQSLAEPFLVDGHQLFIAASVGIACSEPDSTPHSVERAAYIALHNAKRAGKARSMHFDPSMASTPPERLEMEKQLRFALERNEMLLYFQPQLELSSGLVSGAEVLMRWRPEGLGLVSTGAFVPILEETGLIVDFGRWALQEACRQGMEWAQREGFHLRLAVNISALQVAQTDLIRDVEQALSNTGFPPEWLELELTESLFVGDFNAACRGLRALQSIGITCALDDFGTGQSSLCYLQQLPFQRLKIDQSFVRPIQEADQCPPLVENIIRMAGSLGMTTIAEGIETAHQAELLRGAGCKEGQGHFFSPALPPGEFASFCRQKEPVLSLTSL
jgi:diguanylate cyclase (GGDEF)-like protein